MEEPSRPVGHDGHYHELAAIIRGMSVALLGSVLGGGLGFLFGVVMARRLDQHDFGLLVLALSVLSAGAAVTIGGADFAAIRNVAAARTPGAKRGAMVAPIGLVMALNICVAATVTVFAEPISDDFLGQADFTRVLRAAMVALPLTVLAQMFSACLSGLEQARGEVVRKVVEQGGRIVLATLALSLGFGLVAATLGMAVAAAVAAAAVGYVLWRSLPRGGVTVMIGGRAVIGFAWPQTIANIATQTWVLAVVALLTRSTDARTAALFGAAYAISQLPVLVYNAFTYRFSPAIARLWELEEKAPLDRLLKDVTRWVAIFAVPLYAVAITLPGPLLQVYGPKYEQAATALAVMTLAALFSALAGPVERALIMTGRVRLEMTANVTATVVVVGIGVALTPHYGLGKAALSVLLYSVIRNVAKIYFVHRTMGMSTLSRSLVRPLAAAVAASAIVGGISRVTEIGESPLGVAALATALVAAYAAILLGVIGLSEVDRKTLGLALRQSGS